MNTENLESIVKTVIKEKSVSKRKNLNILINKNKKDLQQIIQDIVKVTYKQINPIIIKIIDDILKKYPYLFIDNKSFYPVEQTKEKLQKIILNNLINNFENTIKIHLSSEKLEQSKRNLQNFDRLVQETIEKTILSLNLEITNKQQVNDLLNSITFK